MKRLRGLFQGLSKLACPPADESLVRIASEAAADMLRFASEFGFTPAARSRIAAGVGGQTSNSKFGDLLL